MLKQVQDQNIEVQRKMKEDMVNERNREIEAIIEKLGDETHSTQKQLSAQYNAKAQAMQSEHRREVADLESQLDSVR